MKVENQPSKRNKFESSTDKDFSKSFQQRMNEAKDSGFKVESKKKNLNVK